MKAVVKARLWRMRRVRVVGKSRRAEVWGVKRKRCMRAIHRLLYEFEGK